MPKINLTQKFVNNPTPPPIGKPRIEYCDTALPGLFLEVRDTASWGTFYLRYRNPQGKTSYVRIGRSTDLSLKEARTQAQQLRSEIHRGADPRAEEKQRKQTPTLGEFLTEQYLPDSKRRKRSYETDESIARLRVIPRLGSYRMDQISRKILTDFQNALMDEGLAPATCNHNIKLIRQAYNKAIELEIVLKNPASGMKLFHEDNQVDHRLSDGELARLLKVLRSDSNKTVCRLCLFLLATGARKNEALQARWEHIDEAARAWTIPSANAKSKRVRSVPLNDTALAVLKELRVNQHPDWVFVSRQTGDRLKCVNKVWARVRAAAGLPHLRLHDLRHQAASLYIASGRTLYEVQHILGHADPRVTQRYAHMSTATMQEAANSIDAVLGASGTR